VIRPVLDRCRERSRVGGMKILLLPFCVAFLMSGCGGSDDSQSRLEEKSSSVTLASKCEACGTTISKPAEGCPDCDQPKPTPIAAEKRKAAEKKKRATQVEKRRLDEVRAKELAVTEAKALAEIKAKALAEAAANELDQQQPQPGTTLLEIEVRFGGYNALEQKRRLRRFVEGSETIDVVGPTQIIIGKHPVSSFNGTYQAQAEHANGFLYYKNESDRYLYFYDQAEGGQKGWSLDHRKPDGIKDHYSGGWYYLKSFAHLNSNSIEWRDVEKAKRLAQAEMKAAVRVDEEARKLDEAAKAFAEEAKLRSQGGPAVLAQVRRAREIGATNLRLVGNGITDASPLAELTKLEELDLWNNQIVDLIPLTNLTNLEELDLWGNRVTDLQPLQGLTKLTKLVLVANQITDLKPLVGLTRLIKLYLPQNQITDLTPLADLDKLIKLVLTGNQITDLAPLTGLNKLARLYLSRNQVTDLMPLAKLSNLTSLHLSENQITDLLPLKGLTNLESLWLSNNQVADLTPLSGLTALQELHLEGNPIPEAQKAMLRKALPNCRISF
jgi:hypothetical protein